MINAYYCHKFTISVDPKDPSIEYAWFNIGMLDYDTETKLWLVQKTSAKGRIVDSKNKPVVNGGIQRDGRLLLCYVTLSIVL